MPAVAVTGTVFALAVVVMKPGIVARHRRDPIPFDVDVIVMKALRKEPERRYESVEHLSDELQRYLEGRPVLAAPDTTTYRARKFVRPRNAERATARSKSASRATEVTSAARIDTHPVKA